MTRILIILAAIALAFVIRAEAAAAPGHDLVRSFHCIYRYENGGYGWTANTGNGYYGGLQMDREFMRSYGREFYNAWGTANRWPKEVQITVGIRGYFARGWSPWPTTSRLCGLR